MVSKFSLFITTLLSPFPHRKQQLIELLEEITEDVPATPCCEDILELWAEEFGASGLVLGNIALFLAGFLLMVAVDLFLYRWNSGTISTILRSVSVLYCFFKFRSHLPSTALLILLFTAFWALCGFWWSIAFVFLVYFTNMGAMYAKGGSLC